MKTKYHCDECGRAHDEKVWIFHCIECEKEICESCMFGWATCETCAEGKDEEFLKGRFDEAIFD